MRREIRLGGFGGQGIMLAGYIIGKAALADGKHAVMTQSYGPEMRGARVAADVIVADQEVDYPKVIKPDISVFMFQEAYDHYRTGIEGGIIIYDEDLVKIEDHTDAQVYRIKANHIAEELGRRVVANIAMLGSFTAITQITSREAMERAVIDTVPKKALELNEEAFKRGFEYGKKLLRETKGG